MQFSFATVQPCVPHPLLLTLRIICLELPLRLLRVPGTSFARLSSRIIMDFFAIVDNLLCCMLIGASVENCRCVDFD